MSEKMIKEDTQKLYLCSEQMPEKDYNWVIVIQKAQGTNEPSPFWIARYTNDGWNLYHEDSNDFLDCNCPTLIDSEGFIERDKITHWMKINFISDLVNGSSFTVYNPVTAKKVFHE